MENVQYNNDSSNAVSYTHPPQYPLKSLSIPYQYQIRLANASSAVTSNSSSNNNHISTLLNSYPSNRKKRRNSEKSNNLSNNNSNENLLDTTSNDSSIFLNTNTNLKSIIGIPDNKKIRISNDSTTTTTNTPLFNILNNTTNNNNKNISSSNTNNNNNSIITNIPATPNNNITSDSIQSSTITTTTPNMIIPTSADNVELPSTTTNNTTEIQDDALPLSPVASPGIENDHSMGILITPQHSGTINANNNEHSNLLSNSTMDKIFALQSYSNDIFDTINNQVPRQCWKNILFKLLTNLNRSEMSDLSTLLKDNLKRDFISSLPLEIALNILKNLSFDDIINCTKTCKNWNILINNTPDLWKQLLINESFVSIDNFNKYSNNLRLKYNNKSPIELNYRIDFLENLKILKNWYNPCFLPKRTTLMGHMTSVVTCLQFEDNYIITGADDKMIRVYLANEKKFLLELNGHEGGVWALKYDENGILVSGSTDRTVRIWDIKAGRCTHVFKGHTSTVRCLDIVSYKNVKYIITGSRDNTLHVWKLPTSSSSSSLSEGTTTEPIVYQSTQENPYFVGILRGHMASVRTVSGHGNIVVSGSYDNNLIVWDIIQLKCLYILTGHTDRIYSTIYDHKRKRCISASMDSTIRVWDLKDIWNNGKCARVMNSLTSCTKITGSLYTLQGHTALVGLLRLSDKYLVSAAADGSLRGWDSDDYSRKFAYHHNNLSAITTFYMSDNLLVSGSEGQFNVYDLRSGKLVHGNLLRDADQIWSVNFKGNILVAAVEKDGQSFVELLDFQSS